MGSVENFTPSAVDAVTLKSMEHHNFAPQKSQSLGKQTPCAPTPFEPVALIGMAMRLPGSVHSGDEFWDLLVQKKSGLGDIPSNRLNIDGFYDPFGKPGTIPVNKGYFLDDVEIQHFDPTVFPMPKTELERLDPGQRQLLQVAYECLEDAGVTSWRGSNLGCYIGEFGEDWADLYAKEAQHRGGFRSTGTGDFAFSNRISYEFDLQGPSMTVKTACSSSLVCLELACQAIRGGDCDSALVGGTSLIFSPTTWISLNDQGVLSPRGESRSFDAGADGYARGEAVNMVLVKRLSHAIRDNDTIRAIIRGAGVNSDGRTNGMLTPSPAAQAALIRRTYEAAGIDDMSRTAMVECHGTGTVVGDPLEAEAIANCFGDRGVIITSVKPNMGHSEGASGLTSLIKCVLALEHQQVPPNINFDSPNPKIPFDRCKLHVPTEVEPWPTGRAERVSVNSFGIGGTNAHVILESPRQFGIPSSRSLSNETRASSTNSNGIENPENRQSLLLFSAHSRVSLDAQVDTYHEYIRSSEPTLRDLSYTLANKREHRPHRAYSVAKSTSCIETSVAQAIGETSPRVAWVFTGQGAQWPGMGADMIDTNATFRATIRKLDKYLLMLPAPVSWTIEGEIRKTGAASRVHNSAFGHPMCVAIQIALVDVLRAWGVVPHVIVGHSSGELAAAYACGAITADAAFAAATLRGFSSAASGRKGSMAAIGLGRDEIMPYLLPGVDIACENSHCSVTLSGDTDGVEKIMESLKAEQPGVFARLLRVEKAYHSHHMSEYAPLYEQQLRSIIRSVDPKIAFFSSVTGRRLTGDGNLEASYWRANIESPVLFNSALRAALHGEADSRVVMIEIGPHPALAGPIGQILRDISRPDHVHVGTLARGSGGQERLLHLAGKLYQQSVPLNYAAICPPGKFVTSLPRYNWKKEASYWNEPRVARDWRFREHPPHELLGSRLVDQASDPCWRKVLALEDALWLTGHELNGQTVFPAAGYVAMIGEALRQLSGESTYSLRNVRIATARILELDRPTEMITSLKPPLIDSTDSSPWYEFTISSFDGTRWVRNCFGEAMAAMDKTFRPDARGPRVVPFPRVVDEKNWYKVLRRVGLNYTGLFEGLTSISAATTSSEARASVSAQVQKAAHSGIGSTYALHPAVIDQCFQLFTVASYRGLGRNTSQLAVPTFIEQMVISPSTLDLDVTAKITGMVRRGAWRGDLGAYSAGIPVMSLRGMKTSVLTSSNPAEEEVPLITQLEMTPHCDLVNLERGLHPRAPRLREWPLLEELVLLCSFDHLEQIQTSSKTPKHLIRFHDWMRHYVERFQSGSNVLVSQERRLQDLPHEDRLSRIEQIVAELSVMQDPVFSTAIHRLFKQAPAVFAGETHPLHVLMEDNVLSEFYSVNSFDSADAIRLIANTNPHLRILEVGAGTGGTTARVLEALTSSYGERMYSHYSYTDISAGFMAAAKDRFAGAENIEFAVLDASKDPADQGFQLESYDLIIAANVIHATPCLNKTLRNLHSLLNPGGRLFFEELCPETSIYNYLMGFLEGWWLGADDNRVEQPWISPHRWTEEFVAAGFQEPEAVVLDSPAPYHANAAYIVSRESRSTRSSRVTILCHAPDGPCVDEMQRQLKSLDVAVDIRHLGQSLPSQDVISLLDLQEPTVHGMTEGTFRTVIRYLESHTENIIWVMRASQVSCDDPRSAMMLGLARTARNEYPLKLFTVELDGTTPPPAAAKAIADILFRANSPDVSPETIDIDYEYAVLSGDICVPRLHWQTFTQAFAGLRRKEPPGSTMPKQVAIRTPGLLHTLKWSEGKVTTPAEGEVLVETMAVGVNFKDVLLALGALEEDPNRMGFEGGGIVRAVGPGVQRLAVNDRVMYADSSCYATHKTISESLCVKIVDSMSFTEAAAAPLAYMTAGMALIDKANLQRDESILIHAACGGVGLAAIQIAQMIGAEVYCTVGSEIKRQYLMNNYGIESSHIFNSRDLSFLPAVMDATNERGVDVVLNSLSGDLLHASWKCVAEFGTMVEIGKRDFQRRAKLAMETFEANRTYVGLELSLLIESRPQTAAKLLERCAEWIRSGAVKGPTIYSILPGSQIQEAYRTMQTGSHIGKMVIEMPRDTDELLGDQGLAPATKRTPLFRSDHSYLLTGGLGGLGRAIAVWMVEHGARHLVFLSRSSREGPAIDGFLEDLRSHDCQVQLVAGSISNIRDVQRAVDAANALRPIAGVMNLSMVLKDVGLTDMTFEDWMAAVEPKVHGTWNLHNVTTSASLDFFVLFSSYSSMVGHWGQANYSAANTFLDAFVSYRHQNGLVASVVDIGIMGDVGFVAENPEVFRRMERTGVRILREQDLLDALVLALESSGSAQETGARKYKNPGQVLLGLNTTNPISSPNSRVSWKRDARMSIYHNLDRSSTEASTDSKTIGGTPLKTLLTDREKTNEEKTGIIARRLAGALAKFLIKDDGSIPLDQPLEALGMDSLVAMEMRNWIRQQVNVEMSTLVIVQSASFIHLGDQIRQSMFDEGKV